MERVQIDTIIQPHGRIVIDDLSFEEGKKVEVTISEAKSDAEQVNPYSLRGSVYRYDDPFGPACPPKDWEVLR